jgi:hypothetical protein
MCGVEVVEGVTSRQTRDGQLYCDDIQASHEPPTRRHVDEGRRQSLLAMEIRHCYSPSATFGSSSKLPSRWVLDAQSMGDGVESVVELRSGVWGLKQACCSAHER